MEHGAIRVTHFADYAQTIFELGDKMQTDLYWTRNVFRMRFSYHCSIVVARIAEGASTCTQEKDKLMTSCALHARMFEKTIYRKKNNQNKFRLHQLIS